MGDTPHVIVFCFAGRKPNMELQIPMMRRVVEENPNVEYHIWNLARRKLPDGEYLKHLVPGHDRVSVHHQFYSVRPWRDNLLKVWKHYTQPQYEDCLFLKLDDDIVFIETAGFADYVDMLDTNRGTIVSASVINNGACTRTEPGLWAQFEPTGRSLLDFHSDKRCAELAHRYMMDNWRDVIEAPAEVVPTEDWVSINAIGLDWPTLCDLVGRIGKPSPRWISGRPFPITQLVGDEGAANMLPRAIARGFVVAHLAFGPQNLTQEQMLNWCRAYGKLWKEYEAVIGTRSEAISV